MIYNHKKILCKNIIFNNECKYENKCLYAHSLNEQNVNYLRKCVYDIIKGKDDLSHINLQDDVDLYKTLVQLSVYCHNCVNNKCTGGYNCKYGACKYEFVICLSDLNFNKCTADYTCTRIHLSKRNLKPIKLLLGVKGDCLDNNLLINVSKYIREDYGESSESEISTTHDDILTNESLVNKSIFS
jgi:hypothetical protein